MIRFLLKHRSRTIISAVGSYFLVSTAAALPVCTFENPKRDIITITIFVFAAVQTLMWLEDDK